MVNMLDKITKILGSDVKYLLDHKSTTIAKDNLNLTGADFVGRIFIASDRSNSVLRNLQAVFDHGRLAGTGYLSILPADKGVEHSAGSAFTPNPIYFDPENIVKLAIEGGCNAVASTLGVYCPLVLRTKENFKKDRVNYEESADLTGQANHLRGLP